MCSPESVMSWKRAVDDVGIVITRDCNNDCVVSLFLRLKSRAASVSPCMLRDLALQTKGFGKFSRIILS